MFEKWLPSDGDFWNEILSVMELKKKKEKKIKSN